MGRSRSATDGAALDMLQAMNTGHDGLITTVHSKSPRDSISRVQTMVLMAGMELPARGLGCPSQASAAFSPGGKCLTDGLLSVDRPTANSPLLGIPNHDW